MNTMIRRFALILLAFLMLWLLGVIVESPSFANMRSVLVPGFTLFGLIAAYVIGGGR